MHRWGMTGGSFVLTALLSETISARRELRDIPLGLYQPLCLHIWLMPITLGWL